MTRTSVLGTWRGFGVLGREKFPIAHLLLADGRFLRLIVTTDGEIKEYNFHSPGLASCLNEIVFGL